MNKAQYKKYIQSQKWKTKRLQYFKRYGNECKKCGLKGIKRNLMHLHHKTYDRLGKEKLTDLVSLCKKCHTFFHRHVPANSADLYEQTDAFVGDHEKWLKYWNIEDIRVTVEDAPITNDISTEKVRYKDREVVKFYVVAPNHLIPETKLTFLFSDPTGYFFKCQCGTVQQFTPEQLMDNAKSCSQCK